MQTRMKIIAGTTLFLIFGSGLTIFSSTSPSQEQLHQVSPVARDRSVDVVPVELRHLETSAVFLVNSCPIWPLICTPRSSRC